MRKTKNETFLMQNLMENDANNISSQQNLGGHLVTFGMVLKLTPYLGSVGKLRI